MILFILILLMFIISTGLMIAFARSIPTDFTGWKEIPKGQRNKYLALILSESTKVGLAAALTIFWIELLIKTLTDSVQLNHFLLFAALLTTLALSSELARLFFHQRAKRPSK